MKEFLKKLNNFRLSSTLIACGSIVGIIATVLFFVFYQISGVTTLADGTTEVTIAFQDKQALGMWFFIVGIIALIFGIYVVYTAFPYIFPKEKLQPKRSLGFALAGQNVLVLILTIFAILAMTTEVTRVAAGWAISIVLAALSIIFAGLWMYPNVKCNFYCPEVNKK